MIQSLLLSILVFAVASSTVNGARVDQPNPRVPSPHRLVRCPLVVHSTLSFLPVCSKEHPVVSCGWAAPLLLFF
jgi:hypothetical protein